MKEELLKDIQKLNQNFDINNVEHYKLFINCLYNNVTIFNEQDKEITDAIAALLVKIYQLNDKNNFSARKIFFSKFLQKWMGTFDD